MELKLTSERESIDALRSEMNGFAEWKEMDDPPWMPRWAFTVGPQGEEVEHFETRLD